MTVGTLFHKTHVDLRKWFQAILLLCKSNPNISARKLAKEIQVNRATASLIIKRVEEMPDEQVEMLRAIVHAFD